jgi:penicillin-binding protein 1A
MARKHKRINLQLRRNKAKVLAYALIGLTCIYLLSVYLAYWYFTHDLPDLTKITGYKPRLITEVYSFDGRLIADFTTEKRKLILLEEIPKHVRNALIAVEDKRFFEHEGVDFKRVVGALIKNIREGEIVQGGSTITQQVAKNLVLSPEKSVSRKIKEAILAYRMENNLSKEEILYIYLNHIYLGDGNYGVEAASRSYFGKSAKDINLAEAALLAGLPKRPEYYSPRKYLDRSISRQRLVLKLMDEEGLITAQERRKAEEYQIKIVPRRDINNQVAPYFVELVRQYLENKFGTQAFIDGGYTVFTTLDVDLSLSAQWSLRRGILDLEGRRGRKIVIRHLNTKKEIDNFRNSPNIDTIDIGSSYEAVVTEVADEIPPSVFKAKIAIAKWEGKLRFGVSSPLGKPLENLSFPLSTNYAPLNGYDGISLIPFKLSVGDVVKVNVKREEEGSYYVSLDIAPQFQGALLAMDTKGFVKTVVGGFDFFESQFNRATQASRQPGSSFKPLVYAAAIDKGYTETTIVYDMPVAVKNWAPQNYDGSYLGPISLREALAKSRNLASVRILLDIDPNYAVNYTKQFGFTSHLNPYPSLVLGGSEVSLIEMVKAFNVFASGGKLVEPKLILRIYDRDGKLLEDSTSNPYLSKEDAEKAEREKDRMQIINQIARRLGRNTDTESEFIKETVLTPKDNGHNSTANSGFLTPQEFLKRLQNNSISFASDVGERIISPETAYIMTDLLQAVITQGTGRRALELSSLVPLAGKTGTTNDFTDAWFIGFSPRIVAGVWIGRDTHDTIGKGEAGGKAALPIWIDFMREAIKKFPGGDFKAPDGIRFVSTPYGFIPYRIGIDQINYSDNTYSEDVEDSQEEDVTDESGNEIDFLIRR